MNTLELITEIINDKGFTTVDGSITDETKFFDDLDMDSLDVIEISMNVEKKLNIAIPDDRLEGIQTVGQLVEIADSIKPTEE